MSEQNNDLINYMKQKNQVQLDNQAKMLEEYREAGQDAQEGNEPNYLKKINVIYDQSQEDIVSYRKDLTEMLGEHIESTHTT